MINVTTSEPFVPKSDDKKAFRQTFFNPSSVDKILIIPQEPFTEVSYANIGNYYEIEIFSEIDNLIHYDGQTVDDEIFDEIRDSLECGGSKVYFTEEQIRAYNSGKFSTSSCQ